jgi:quinol monooxygenase YgiN
VVIVVARLEVASDHVSEFESSAAVLCEATRREAGCISYSCARSIDAGHHYVFVEQFADERALVEHLGRDHTQRFTDGLGRGVLRGRPDATCFTVASAGPLPSPEVAR